MLFGRKPRPVSPQDALPRRPDRPFRIAPDHVVLGTPLEGPVPDGYQVITFAMGCLWGSERIFWEIPGVHTAAGYQAAHPEPDVTTRPARPDRASRGRPGGPTTPTRVDLETLLKAFWENHDPTTPDRQGNDVGTQYRSAVYPTADAQLAEVEESRRATAGASSSPASARSRPRSGGGRRGPVLVRRGLPPGLPAQDPRGYCNHGSARSARRQGPRPGRADPGGVPRGLTTRAPRSGPGRLGNRARPAGPLRPGLRSARGRPAPRTPAGAPSSCAWQVSNPGSRAPPAR